MTELAWPVGAVLVLIAAHAIGGMLLLIAVAAAMTLLFKGLGDRAAK